MQPSSLAHIRSQPNLDNSATTKHPLKTDEKPEITRTLCRS